MFYIRDSALQEESGTEFHTGLRLSVQACPLKVERLGIVQRIERGLQRPTP
jgi:hypothetical protein